MRGIILILALVIHFSIFGMQFSLSRDKVSIDKKDSPPLASVTLNVGASDQQNSHVSKTEEEIIDQSTPKTHRVKRSRFQIYENKATSNSCSLRMKVVAVLVATGLVSAGTALGVYFSRC